MKGSNSRLSHRPALRYSNLAQEQGTMVTDADLTEAGQLHQARDEAQGMVTVRSGTPAMDGAVNLDDGEPLLAPGWVIAEGKQGLLERASGGTGAGMDLFTDQADLPLGPPLPEGRAFLYADLWERPVFARQDPYLSDPGLHGAETAYRTRTMVQIKAMPVGDETDADMVQRINAEDGPFLRKGTAQASVSPKDPTIAVDDCDPCADQVDVEQDVPNALFRVEVVAVRRNAAGTPLRVTLAWSYENGAAVETAAALEDEGVRADFSRQGGVYEFFSDATEAQIGVFSSGHDAERPVLTDVIHPAPPPAAGANGGAAYSHVRRWFGSGTVILSSGNTTDDLGEGVLGYASDGDAITLTLDEFTLQIGTDGAQFMAGDYWLVEMRRYAPEALRIRLVGGDGLTGAPPYGIQHHICPLFFVDGDATLELEDAARRRLCFPPLTDIPASHVSYDPACSDLFHGAENVQDALDALCDLNATEVTYDPSDGCERFEGVTTVAQALERMCSVQDETAVTRVLRLMMDWGVVCGISVARASNFDTRVNWSAGTLLDRRGRLIDVAAGSFDLRNLPEENIHGDLGRIMANDREICLSMAAGPDGALQLHLSDRAFAFAPADPTFEEAVRACKEGRRKIDFGGIYRPLGTAEVQVIDDVVSVWSNWKALGGAVPMSAENEAVAIAVNNSLLEAYRETATPEKVAGVEALFALAEREYDPTAVRGAARDKRRMQKEAAKLGILANADVQDSRDCECIHGLPPCPPDLDGRLPLVPIAGIRMDPSGDRPGPISMVCPFTCRKQAHTMRSVRYYEGDMFRRRFEELAKQCCSSFRDPDNPPRLDLGDYLDNWNDELFIPYEPVPIPLPEPEPGLPWPPKIDPYDVFVPGAGYPQTGAYGPLINPKPDVLRLPPQAANDLLIGNGYAVVGTIDAGADDPLTEIKSLVGDGVTLTGKDVAEPGDSVVMVAREGQVIDTIVVSKGSGRLPFETESETEAKVTKIIEGLDLGRAATETAPGTDTATGVFQPGIAAEPRFELPDLDVFENRLAELLERQSAAESNLTRMTTERTRLAGDLTSLEGQLSTLTTARATTEADLTRLSQNRDRLSGEITSLEGQLDTLTTSRTSAEADLGRLAETRTRLSGDVANLGREIETLEARRVTANTELTALVEAQEELVVNIRREQPIEAVVTDNPAAAERLRASGITTAGALENADTNTISRALRNTGTNTRNVRNLNTNFLRNR
ncbi:MAG: hypothetical protein AAF667_04690 [Pseudomonadota bacterium]